MNQTNPEESSIDSTLVEETLIDTMIESDSPEEQIFHDFSKTPHYQWKPDFWSKFIIIEMLGRGRFGAVYKVFSVDNNMNYALKVLFPNYNNIISKFNEPFVMKILSEKTCPNGIVCYRGSFKVPKVPENVYYDEEDESGESDENSKENVYVLLIDYIDGVNFGDYLKNNTLDYIRTARYLKLLSSSLSYIHERGIAHRDIKPDNILIDKRNSEPYIVDFGISCAENLLPNELYVRKCSEIKTIVGTPLYLPPLETEKNSEMIFSKLKSDDIYSLGVTMIQALSGKTPDWVSGFGGFDFEKFISFLKNKIPFEEGDEQKVAIYFLLLQMVHTDWRQRPTTQYINELIGAVYPDIFSW